MKRFKLNGILVKSLGVVILIILLSRLDIKEISQQLRRINLGYYISGLALFVPLLFLKAMRWRYLLKGQSINISHRESIRFYLSSMFVGSITPGRAGEMIRVFYIKDKGFSIGQACFSVFIDRLADMIFLGAIGLVGMIFFLGLFERHIEVICVFLLSVIAAVVVFVLARDRSKRLVRRLATFLLPDGGSEAVVSNLRSFAKSFETIGFKSVAFIAFTTLVSWLCYYVEMFIFAKALTLDVSLWYISAVVSITALVALIPVSIAGIGTRDATLVLLFSQVGLPKESAIAFSSLVLLMLVLNAGICSIGWFLNK